MSCCKCDCRTIFWPFSKLKKSYMQSSWIFIPKKGHFGHPIQNGSTKNVQAMAFVHFLSQPQTLHFLLLCCSVLSQWNPKYLISATLLHPIPKTIFFRVYVGFLRHQTEQPRTKTFECYVSSEIFEKHHLWKMFGQPVWIGRLKCHFSAIRILIMWLFLVFGKLPKEALTIKSTIEKDEKTTSYLP